jgi:uncharacterized protein YmfQ (DUF2313 family)
MKTDTKNERICKITNDKFSWVLEVDKKTINLLGSDNADYFAELYAKLGYKIIWDRDKWKREMDGFSK